MLLETGANRFSRQNILIVCEFNQARSNFASAALQHTCGHLNFYSAGISAKNNSPVPRAITNLEKSWGLDYFKSYSEPLSEVLKEEKKFSLIITVDENIKRKVDKLESLTSSVISMTDSHIPEIMRPMKLDGKKHPPVTSELFARIVSTSVAAARFIINQSDVLEKKKGHQTRLCLISNVFEEKELADYFIQNCMTGTPPCILDFRVLSKFKDEFSEPRFMAHFVTKSFDDYFAEIDLKQNDESCRTGKQGIYIPCSFFNPYQKTFTSGFRNFNQMVNQHKDIYFLCDEISENSLLSIQSLLVSAYADQVVHFR
jgi:protein-tyrosine-phosphatase